MICFASEELERLMTFLCHPDAVELNSNLDTQSPPFSLLHSPVLREKSKYLSHNESWGGEQHHTSTYKTQLKRFLTRCHPVIWVFLSLFHFLFWSFKVEKHLHINVATAFEIHFQKYYEDIWSAFFFSGIFCVYCPSLLVSKEIWLGA